MVLCLYWRWPRGTVEKALVKESKKSFMGTCQWRIQDCPGGFVFLPKKSDDLFYSSDSRGTFKLNSFNCVFTAPTSLSRHPRQFTLRNPARFLQELLQKMSLFLRGEGGCPNPTNVTVWIRPCLYLGLCNCKVATALLRPISIDVTSACVPQTRSTAILLTVAAMVTGTQRQVWSLNVQK